jgi:hypothetical protein
MSSVSFGGGCSAAAFTSLQSSRAGEASKTEQLFGKLDTSGDGEIDATELGAFVDAIAAKTGGAAIDSSGLMASLDSDGNGSISSTEFGDNLQSLFDQLRGQVMGSQLQSRPPPPDGAGDPPGGANDQLGTMLASLLKDYGVSGATSTSLEVAA